MNFNAEQKEALMAAEDYLKRLIPAMEEMVRELRTGRTELTDQLITNCINGFNWVISIFNQLSEVINTGEIRINKDEINPKIEELIKHLDKKDDIRTANVVTVHIIPFLRRLLLAINESLA